MIQIKFNGRKPSADWIARADAVTAQLLEVGLSDGAKRKLIDDNAQIWRDLTSWLEGISNGKCWYTESMDHASYWHVDHFRPKNQVKDLNGNTFKGYWWLAFDWQNYRLAGSAVNTRKSSKFPVRESTYRACTPNDDIDDEFPYLLDPTCNDDTALLSFNEQGKAIAGEPQNGWHKERADVSIKILNLNYHSLRRGRKQVWNKSDRYVKEVLSCKDTLNEKTSHSKRQKLRDSIVELKNMVARDAEFSAVAKACVRTQGDPWLVRAVIGG